jgi:predicted dehydrogenase
MGELLKQPDAVVTAVCEVWQTRRDRALEACKGTAKGYNDYREVLARPDIDAVLIATPPHWHAKMAIDAAEAGKDFYLEKPMTLTVGECLAVKRAAAKHKCVTQVGTQVHASENWRRIVDVIRSGILGKITAARAMHVMNAGPEGIGNVTDTDPPAGLDWDLWLGPGPKRGYNALLAKDSAHHPSFMAYSGGWTPGMAPHLLDLVFWALELGHPSCATSSGGRYLVRDCGDAYDTHEAMWQYPNFTMTWWTSLVSSYGFDNQGGPGCGRRRCIYFQGVNGTLICDYGFLRIVPEGDRLKLPKSASEAGVPTTQPLEKRILAAIPQVIPPSPGHHREWLDGVRARKQPSCSVEYHSKIDMALNLAMLSLKLGRSVRFDPATETIPDDAEANKLIKPQYREPWQFADKYL